MRREGSTLAGIAIVAIGFLLFLPALYVLSIGPAVLLVEYGCLSEPAAEAVYSPMILAVEVCGLETPMEMYINLWMGEPFATVSAPATCIPPTPLPPPLPANFQPAPSGAYPSSTPPPANVE